MLHRHVAFGIAGVFLAVLTGCDSPPSTYVQALVARTDAGPVLVILDNSDIAWISTVDLNTGRRSDRLPLGTQGKCLPASTGRIWCGYTAGSAEFEHESWDLATLTYLADNQTIADNSPSSFAAEQIQSNDGVLIRKTDHALVLSNADVNAPEGYWAVDPQTFAVAPFAFDDDAQVIPGLESDETQWALTANRVRVGDQDYWIDNDTSVLESAPAGTDTWTPVSPAQTFLDGRFALADGYADTAGPVVAHDPESVFVVTHLGDTGESVGYAIARVALADGKVLWTTEAKDAQFVDVVASAGGVLAVVLRLTPFAGTVEEQAPIHARILGVDVASGTARWTLTI